MRSARTRLSQAKGNLSLLSSPSVSNLTPSAIEGRRSTNPKSPNSREYSNTRRDRTEESIGYQRILQRRKRNQQSTSSDGSTDGQAKQSPNKRVRTTTAKVQFADEAELPPTSQQVIDRKRNEDRVIQRDERDRELMGKYLPSLDNVFNELVEGPDDDFEPPSWFLQAVQEVAGTAVQPPKAPPIKFATDDKSLADNARLLERFDFDIAELLDHFADTTIGYGSEFRPTEQLQKIFGGHPNFGFFKETLRKGMDYCFDTEISEEQRVLELEANLERGNHKSATSKPDITEKQLLKDVYHGFSFPFPSGMVRKLKGALVQPCGLATQFALNAGGSREEKHRLTHDLSYEITGEGISVNNRVNMSRYPEMIFGWCLPRIIHFVVALRIAYPTSRILIAKYDFSDAYRRINHSARAAVQSIIVFTAIAFLALRLSFGGSPNPPTWCSFSEMVTDLSNEIPLCNDWDSTTLRSPGQPTTPVPKILDDSVPFTCGRSLAVAIPTTVTARTDSFIDDLVRVFLDTTENRETQPHAVPLAIFVANRPHAGDAEPVPRRENLSGPKLVAEGTPAELQIVLGWEMNTRLLLVILPFDKFVAWTSDINDAIQTRTITLGELHSLVGRLNHAAYVIPLSRHFLGRLRQRLHFVKNNRQQVTLSTQEIADLVLWTHFLSHARAGISMNLLTLRRPSQVGISDSCPFGMGGFTWTGRAWRIKIPPSSAIYGMSEANNVLEFLAMAVTIWLNILDCAAQGLTSECILGLGDNTSAIGWIFRSTRLPPDSAYYAPVQLIARKIARLTTESRQCLCSQHLKGGSNFIADWLSFTTQTRDGKTNPVAFDDPADDLLTQRFHSSFPQLIPQHFEISPLPDEILSFVEQALRITESSMIQSSRKRMKTAIVPGDAGLASESTRGSWTRSCLIFPRRSENSSSAPSSAPTKLPTGTSQEAFLGQIRKPWLARLSELPQAIWLRRFGTVSNSAPFTSRTAPGCSPPSQPSSKP